MAICKARSLAEKNAGAVEFSRTGNPELGDFEGAVVLLSAGDVPDDMLSYTQQG